MNVDANWRGVDNTVVVATFGADKILARHSHRCEISGDCCDGTTNSAPAKTMELVSAPRSSAEIGDFFAGRALESAKDLCDKNWTRTNGCLLDV